MTNKVRIVSAIAGRSGTTFYLESGRELNLANDDAKTIKIMDLVVEALKRGEKITIDLDDFSVERKIEKHTNGVVRFMRGTLSKIKAALALEVIDEAEYEQLGQVKRQQPAPVNTTPVGTPSQIIRGDFESGELHAIVNGKVIPGVEALEKHMEAAVEAEDTEGFQKFMERIAAVIDQRSHSVQELLNFMKKGDLPIAKDGSIVAYKVLKTGNGAFVDCHSGQVTQKLGSLVQMDEKLVDPNRRNECSTGLHIARRAYLGHFGGNIITLVKVAPEDVIAVPPDEPNKMRARAYQICAVLPQEVHATLRNNRPMTGNTKASQMLADVIAGNHSPVLEVVNIGAAKGGNVTITPVDGAKKLPRAAKLTSGVAKALDDRPEEKVEPLNIKEVRRKVDEAYDAQQAAKPKKAAAKKVSAPKLIEVSAKKVVVAQQIPEKYQQALQMIADGKSQREVAKLLNVCPKTMRKYLKG